MEKPYQLGIYEKAMQGSYTIPEKLRAAKRAGFDYMEISIDETDEKLARLEYGTRETGAIVHSMLREDFYIRTMCLSGHRRFPLGSHDAGIRKHSLHIMRKAVDSADALGIRIIQLAGYDVYYEDSDRDTEKYFRENLARAVNIAAAKGILLGFETMETPFLDTVEKAMRYVNHINSPYLGVYPDIGNLKNASLVHGHELVGDIKTGTGHILAAHLKETVPGVYRDCRFGDGHTEYLPCIEELYRQGVRLFTGEFWYAEGGGDADLAEANRFLRTKIKGAIEQSSLSGGNMDHDSLPDHSR